MPLPTPMPTPPTPAPATAPPSALSARQSSPPHLTRAQAPLTLPWQAVDEFGSLADVQIPAERALTLYLDKQELITLMTLGASPEWLVLGYLRNQRLVTALDEVASITVDWSAGDAPGLSPLGHGIAAVKTRAGRPSQPARSAHRVVTTGCGQGSVLGDVFADLAQLALPPPCERTLTGLLAVAQLHAVVNTMRLQETTYKSAGSVHACALFAVPADGASPTLLTMVEDVGRHNALDTIAGWWWMQAGVPGGATATGADKLLYTTGRLTSEMILKAAQMGVPWVVSRSGITQMGAQIAQSLGVCAVGRALNQRFLCYTAPQRLRWPGAAGTIPA